MNNEKLPKKATIPKKEVKPALNFLLMGAGSMFTGMIISGFLVGFAIDYLLGTAPIFMLGCGVLGFIGGFLKVQALSQKLDATVETKEFKK